MTPIEFFILASVLLLIVLWLPFVLVMHFLLPWAFGPEAVVPWTGARRWKLLLSIAGLITATVCLFGMCLAYVETPTPPSADRSWLNPERIWNGLRTSHPVMVRFQDAVMAFGLLELWAALLVLMGVKLRGKWLRGRTSEAERRLGLAGVFAWLSWPNVLWATAVTVGMTAFVVFIMQGHPAAGRDEAVMWTLLITAAITLGTLVAFPLIRTMRAPAPPAADAPADPFARSPSDLSPERQRVLRLLEDGRISADEAAELLAALAATVSPDAPTAGPLTRSRKWVLAGAAVVLVGFFLPWFRVSPVAELQRAIGIDPASISSGFPAEAMMSTLRINGRPVPALSPGQSAETMRVSVAGGDVGHGLGWLILAGALAAAAMPYVVTGLSRPAQRQAAWLATGVATLLALYLLTNAPSAASFGLGLVVIGLGVQWAGLVSDLPRRAVTAGAVAAV